MTRHRPGTQFRTREDRFQALVAALSEGIVLQDLSGKIIDWNESAERILGLSSDELGGRTSMDPRWQSIHEDGSPFNGQEHPAMRTLRTGQPCRNVVMGIRKRTGELTWISINSEPIRGADEGGLEAVVTSFSDITERKRFELELAASETRYRRIIETTQEGVWMIDQNGITTYVNRQMAEMIGFAPEEMIGAHLFDFMDAEARAEAERNLSRRRMGLRDLHDFRLRRKDGSGIWTLMVTNPFFDKDGGYVGALAMVTDISERKRAEKEREELLARERKSRQEAELANRAKDRFLAILSHELRTPLTTILGWTQLFKKFPDRQDMISKGIELIDQSAHAQAELINDLLDISRIIAGKLHLERRALDLHGPLGSALNSIQDEAARKRISIRCSIPDSPIAVLGDSIRLQQIFWNLLSNAIKFSAEGSSIELTVEQVGDDRARITVHDEGVGISRAFLPRVFEMFAQADDSNTRRQQGLGLGLAIARSLVEAHSGRVSAHSEGPGKGSTFTVELPLRQVERTESASLSPSVGGASRHETEHAKKIAGKRILLVEDHSETRETLTTIFRTFGAEVQAAASAPEARERLARSSFDFLVCDIAMPGEDGISLIGKIRQLDSGWDRTLPALALTAHAGPEDQEKALLAGFDMYLPKPVELPRLLDALFKLAEIRRAPA